MTTTRISKKVETRILRDFENFDSKMRELSSYKNKPMSGKAVPHKVLLDTFNNIVFGFDTSGLSSSDSSTVPVPNLLEEDVILTHCVTINERGEEIPDMFNLLAVIRGPSCTPYEGGTFLLSIHISSNYPFLPPLVRAITPIYHMNVNGSDYSYYRNRVCCLGTERLLCRKNPRFTKAASSGWTPELTLAHVLFNICDGFRNPNLDRPLMYNRRTGSPANASGHIISACGDISRYYEYLCDPVKYQAIAADIAKLATVELAMQHFSAASTAVITEEEEDLRNEHFYDDEPNFRDSSFATKLLYHGIPGTSEYPCNSKHKFLFGSEFDITRWLHKDVLDLLDLIEENRSQDPPLSNDDIITALLGNGLLRLETEGVYSIPFFTYEFCGFLSDEIDNYHAFATARGLEIFRPNSMNNYGLVLNAIGMRDFITDLQQRVLLPISKILYPAESSNFDDHHSFVVSYEPHKDTGLDMHTDDSDVTWNICLGTEGFQASGLTFCGYKGAANHRQLSKVYKHEIGRACVHLGMKRHGADNITAGERHNLIIWCTSSEYRSSDAYHAMRTTYEKEQSIPHRECLSWTHDRDFELYRDLPNQHAKATRERLKQNDELWCPPRGFGYRGIEEQLETSKSSGAGGASANQFIL